MVSTKLIYPNTNQQAKKDVEGRKTPSMSLNEVILINKLRNKKVMRNYKGVSIEHLKGLHKGKDVYVVGSGPSLQHVDPKFFENKIVVGCNGVRNHIPCTYTIKIHSIQQEEKLHGSKLVMCEHDCGCSTRLNHYHEPFYYFKHLRNTGMGLDTSVLDSNDQLVVGGTVMSSAIHLAYYMGASNIVLVGHDCGFLDNKSNLDNYNQGENKKKEISVLKRDCNIWESQTLKLVNILRGKGVGVMSINPFINFNLEGHKYTR